MPCGFQTKVIISIRAYRIRGEHWNAERVWLLSSISANPQGISLLIDLEVRKPVLLGQGWNTAALFGPKLRESCHRLPHNQALAWLHWHWISCVCVCLRESERESSDTRQSHGLLTTIAAVLVLLEARIRHRVIVFDCVSVRLCVRGSPERV